MSRHPGISEELRRDMEEHDYPDPVKAMEALAAVAGDVWDDVDAEEYVRELRDDSVSTGSEAKKSA